MSHQTVSFTRRNFLHLGALLTSATTLGFSGLFGLSPAAAAADGDDVQTMLDVAATAETFACTHYHRALTSKVKFSAVQISYIKAALDEELAHLEFLNKNGAVAKAQSFYFPTGTFNTPASFGGVSAIAETVFVGAYLAATRRFAELGNPILAATTAQIAVVEGQHLALVRQTAGELPNNLAFAEPIFFNVSEAVGAVAPLLTGKQGGLGAMEATSVTYPGAAVIRAAIGKSLLAPAKPFTDVTAPTSGTAAATQNATAAATQRATSAATAIK